MSKGQKEVGRRVFRLIFYVKRTERNGQQNVLSDQSSQKDREKCVKKEFFSDLEGGCGDCAQYLPPLCLGLQCNLMVN